MPPRRFPFLNGPALAIGAAIAAIIGGCLSWPLDIPGASGFVGRGLAQSYGLTLTAFGRTELSLLPLPRLSFAEATIAAGGPDGPVLARGGTLTLQLSLSALAGGRVELVTAALDGAEITLPAREDPGWKATLERLSAVAASDAVAHPQRITLQRVRLTGRDPRDGRRQTADAIDATVSWPLWSAALDARGRFTWNAGQVQFAVSGLRPTDLIAGHETPVLATAEWKSGALSIDGRGHLDAKAALTGRARLHMSDLSETLAWIGTDLALSPLIEALTLEGEVEVDREGLRLPSLQVRADETVLVGAGSVEMAGGRPSIRATLDAESLTLSPVFANLLQTGDLKDVLGADWARRPLDWKRYAGGDLDLRLSSSDVRLGPLRIEGLAGGLLVRADTIEATLRKASLYGGTLKGRILVGAPGDAVETESTLRATGAFEQIDLSSAQADLGRNGWIAGPARGSFALTSSGQDLGTMLERLVGRASIAVDDGAIAGLDLAEALNGEGPPAPHLLARERARTAFDRARLSVAFQDGRGEFDDCALDGSSLSASLRGQVSLVERTLWAEATLTQPAMLRQPATRSLTLPTAPPVATYVMVGPWSAIDVRVKARRDGAATTIAPTLAARPDAGRPDPSPRLSAPSP